MYFHLSREPQSEIIAIVGVDKDRTMTINPTNHKNLLPYSGPVTFDTAERYWAGKTSEHKCQKVEKRTYHLFQRHLRFKIHATFIDGTLSSYEVLGPFSGREKSSDNPTQNL